MDAYQEKALGKVSQADQDAEAVASHKISTEAAIILILVAIILDVISVFEVPVADIIAWIIEIPLLLYFYYSGASSTRQIAANLLAWAAEIIPMIDILPLYLVGMIIVIVLDRNETLARVAAHVPAAKSAGGKLASGGGAQGGRLAKNKMFGAASQKYLDQANQYTQKIDTLRAKVPGKLRSVPQSPQLQASQNATPANKTPVLDTPALPNLSPEERRVSRTYGYQTTSGSVSVSTTQAPQASTADTNPFMSPYYDLEQDALPDLETIMNVDVGGERLAQIPTPPVGNGQPKQVQ